MGERELYAIFEGGHRLRRFVRHIGDCSPPSFVAGMVIIRLSYQYCAGCKGTRSACGLTLRLLDTALLLIALQLIGVP